MEIRHFKFDQIGSTQQWVKENISSHLEENLLVSTEHQEGGVGRHGNTWKQFGSSLAFSFTLTPCDVLTLTPLEIGTLLVKFFQEKGAELVLKWPNDLLVVDENRLKKAGGILCHYSDSQTLIFGVGINLQRVDSLPNENFKFEVGHLNVELSKYTDFSHDLPVQIYEYILNNRMKPEEIKSQWNRDCCHLNKKVKIVDDKKETLGTFVGIGENGEALIDTSDGVQKVISGSLWILD